MYLSIIIPAYNCKEDVACEMGRLFLLFRQFGAADTESRAVLQALLGAIYDNEN